jgi:N-acetylglutamate synthase-like GNAT family acetyltransferase
MKKFVLIIYFLSTIMAMNKGLEEGSDLFLNKILVLGIGGQHGAEYKISVFEELRPHAKNIYACDTEFNYIAKELLRKKYIDNFFLLKPDSPDINSEVIIEKLTKEQVILDAVVTVREEWLQTASYVAKALGLPHQNLKAYQTSQDKYSAREYLKLQGIENFLHETSNASELQLTASNFGYPLFIKPKLGIRSEWARLIANEKALEQYIEDIKSTSSKSLSDEYFVLEELLIGHEVDADIVLNEGKLLYGNVSDNFPVFQPFALETGQLSPSILPKIFQEAIIDHAFKVVKTLGYDRGVLHVELMLKNDGKIALIEVNGRPGGMYIADWHKQIWGVYLIKAQLAIAAGKDPKPYLEAKEPSFALAQLCVTTKSDKYQNSLKTMLVKEWVNFNYFKDHPLTFKAAIWDPLPFLSTTDWISGHSNIGEITIQGQDPLTAFQNLMKICHKTPPVLTTNLGKIESSTSAINKFLLNAPEGIARFFIREAKKTDLPVLQSLLLHLTKRSDGNFPVYIPSSLEILLACDSLAPKEKSIIGTLSLYSWEALRPTGNAKNTHLQDLVVLPGYRELGIGEKLMRTALINMQKKSVSKASLACEESLVKYYEKFGFKPTAFYMVQYLEPKL